MKPTRDELELDLRTLELAIAVCDDESRRVPAKYDRAAFQAGACRCAFRLRGLAVREGKP